MRPLALSPWIILAVICTQLVGPAGLWAAEQRGIRIEATRPIVVSALNGEQLTVQHEERVKTLQFHEGLPEGARVSTGAGTTAELLLGERAVITLGAGTTVQMRRVSADQTTIQVTKGTVRVAAAASALGSQGLVTVQTPTTQVQTRGGILRVLVEAPVGKAEQGPTGAAQVYRVAASPERLLAAVTSPSDIIQVEEGLAEIPGGGPAGAPLAMHAGQRVAVQAGRAGALAELVTPGELSTGILASTGHKLTPKEGRDYLVALQVNQATQLGKVLTGAAETSQGEPEKKTDTKNVINGATGGVILTSNTALVNTLFGSGSTASPLSGGTIERSGASYGGNGNTDFVLDTGGVNGRKRNGAEALLVFTRKDSLEPFVKQDKTLTFLDPNTNETSSFRYTKNSPCLLDCLGAHRDALQFSNVGFRHLQSETSRITIEKEMILVGGAQNASHGGIAPTETLILRGPLDSISDRESYTNLSVFLGDIYPANGIGDFRPVPSPIQNANSTVVVETTSGFTTKIPEQGFDVDGNPILEYVDGYAGGTLGQFSSRTELVEFEKNGVIGRGGIVAQGVPINGATYIQAAITATGNNVQLKGGVTLDQGTIATIGTTQATNTYFNALPTTFGHKFSGSLLSVIAGTNGAPTSLSMQDRMLGVYDKSTVAGGNPTCTDQNCNKALLSVLNAKLKGPGSSIPLIDIAAGTHFDRDGKKTSGSQPNVSVTSALVIRSTIPLDDALLQASAPLFALTNAKMETTSHFADLAGNSAQSMKLGDALVALSASNLVIKGNLLNLNNATAVISGYLFSLNNSSQLTIQNGGTLFSLNDRSSLTLNGNAFGVFGSGNNTLTIENNLCTGDCGRLMNSAGQPILLDGAPLKVSGVTQDVVLPNGFNPFALAPGATASSAKIDIDANDALFHIDPTSTLTINGTKVK